MKVKALRNIVSTDHGIIGKGEAKEIPDKLAAIWVKDGVVEKIKEDKSAPTKRAPQKEKAVKLEKSEKAVK